MRALCERGIEFQKRTHVERVFIGKPGPESGFACLTRVEIAVGGGGLRRALLSAL